MTGIGMWTIAAERPQLAAIVDPDGRTLTYGELATEADRIGRGLRDAGLEAGDTIALLLPNGADILTAYFAAAQIGLHVVPLNWHLTAAEIGYILRDCGARAFIAHERFAGAAREAGRSVPSRFAVGDIPGFAPLSALGAGGSGRPFPRTLGALMVYTSGTSGRPKGVRRPLLGLDPDQVAPVSLWFFGLFGLRPFDDHVHLCCSPLYHTAVMNFAVISLQFGHTVVVMDHWDAEEFLRLVSAHRGTHSHMVPTQFRRLLALPAHTRRRYDVSSMRAMIHGAAPCPQPVKRDMLDWFGPVVIEYYAASEGGGTLITAAEWLQRPGSVGRAWPGSRIRVLDDDGKDRLPGEPGTVYLQMGDATFEYHGDAEKTRASWRDRMFTVGDIGYLDDDGYLFLCDRASDVIITGGVNVYPAEIENELAVHPAVADAAVFGIPHDEWGEEIKAVVQPQPGIDPGPALTTELLAFLAGRVARFKLPRTVDYVAELPRDPNGKLYKRLLRDPYWSGRDRAI
ncbi:long-chain acyl-CoA synthetase [Actinoplanes campanulatus]|uniref:Long-chain acyl-CoA synthetase n=1 Tax=Actinoplanes campanulatus TaxID=113559 RepID=A0A7W5FE51_9ACTN|nr:acyl-CoA synthetase [Actinoplanes campanulatus]MBB3095036.1 long-chain acyl-CoA synthetase [Actinoplanes campanulatus]GGN23011.1 putative acyl-CoA ligase [Actinoplanes campanulatus]GID34640.1 putative acyl-CoA ligase [Actinoplanes campanulatus]